MRSVTSEALAVAEASEPTFGLASLVQPLTPQQFKEQCWPRRPWVSRGPVERFGALARIPEMRDLATLLQTWKGKAMAAPPRGSTFTSVEIGAEQMATFYRNGFTLYLHHVEKQVPALQPFARALERELGLPPGEIFCEAYASQAGSGARPHFDANLTFNVQLRGSKVWRMAENRSVLHPHIGRGLHEPMSDGLERYAKRPTPVDMPQDAERIEAEAGTVVFIPHGYLHDTVAEEPSFSIIFTAKARSWSKLLLGELEQKLLEFEHWREMAVGLTSLGAEREENLQRLGGLIQELKGILDAMSPEQMLARWSGGRGASFMRRPGLTLALSRQKEQERDTWFLTTNAAEGSRTEVAPQLVPVLRWLADREQPFDVEKALQSILDLKPADVLFALNTLANVGLIVRCQG
jgi:50S ribosomal protein L16 3-hydroxylase